MEPPKPWPTPPARCWVAPAIGWRWRELAVISAAVNPCTPRRPSVDKGERYALVYPYPVRSEGRCVP